MVLNGSSEGFCRSSANPRPEGAIEHMLDIFANLFAYGPPGGITPGIAVYWTVVWTVVLGGALYVSLFYPAWLKMDDDHH